MSEENFTQRDMENKQLKEKMKLKEENEKLRKENEKLKEKRENENENENENVKDANIKELIEEPKEMKSPNWFDKNNYYWQQYIWLQK